MNATLIRTRPIIKAGDGIVIETTRGEYEGRKGPFFSVNDIIDYTDENSLVIYHDAGGNFRDITEDTADDYLTKYPRTTPDDDVPPYVKNSTAWNIFCESFSERPQKEASCAMYYANSAGRR